MKRIQKMPPIMFTVPWDKLDDKNTYFWYYKSQVETKPCRNECANLDEALAKCARGANAGFETYVSTFVPKFGQHMVVAMSHNGRFYDLFFGNTGKQVNEALNALMESVPTASGKELPMQVIKVANGGKDDKCVMTVECIFDDDAMRQPEEWCKRYTFITTEALTEGIHRTCKTKTNEYKSVKIVKVNEPKFASQLSHELSWYVTLFNYWLKEHEDAWLAYEASLQEDYPEDYEAFEAMRDCYQPSLPPELDRVKL